MATVAGLFPDRNSAQQAIQALQAAGFSPDRIGIVMRDQRETREAANEMDVANSTAGAVTGGAIGGTLGAILAATGALVIPGIGPFVAGGILGTALVGGVAGWLVGGLVALGIPREEAEYYQGQVEQGNVLVTVDAGDQEERARAVFMQSGAQNLQESPGANDNAYQSVPAANQPVDATTNPVAPEPPVSQSQPVNTAGSATPVVPPSGVYSDMGATNPSGTPPEPLPNEQAYAAQQSGVPTEQTEPSEPAQAEPPRQRVILPQEFVNNPQAARNYGVGATPDTPGTPGAPDTAGAPREQANSGVVGSSAPTNDAVPLTGQPTPRPDAPAATPTDAPEDADGEPRFTRDDDIIRREQQGLE